MGFQSVPHILKANYAETMFLALLWGLGVGF